MVKALAVSAKFSGLELAAFYLSTTSLETITCSASLQHTTSLSSCVSMFSLTKENKTKKIWSISKFRPTPPHPFVLEASFHVFCVPAAGLARTVIWFSLWCYYLWNHHSLPQGPRLGVLHKSELQSPLWLMIRTDLLTPLHPHCL